MDNQIKIEEWETQFDKFTDYYKCTPQFKSYIRTLLKSQRESRDKELGEKIENLPRRIDGDGEQWHTHEDILSLLKEDIKN